jgi:hypothetical protein
VSGYRDDLDAAQNRIARLEAEVAELHAQLEQTPAQQARLAELQQRRDDAMDLVRRAGHEMRRALVVAGAFGLAAAFVFVAAIVSMGSSGHPLNAAIFSGAVIAPVLVVIAWVGGARRDARVKDVVALDRQIAELSTQADRVRVAAPRARVAGETEDDARVEADEENEDAVSKRERAER